MEVTSLPSQTERYRFLNHSRFAWRQLLHALSFKVVRKFESLTSSFRIRTFIIDDSVLRRDRSKKAELLARVHDHTTGRFVRGYTMHTIGWSNG